MCFLKSYGQLLFDSMKKYKIIKCSSPKCKNDIFLSVERITRVFKYSVTGNYCNECRKKYPLKILRLQTLYEEPIQDLLITVARTFNFKSLEVVKNVLGVVWQKTFLDWLKEYLVCNSWSEFKKKYACNNPTCVRIYYPTLFSNRFKNKNYIISKMKKDFGICSCLDSEKNTIIVKVYSIKDLEKIQQYSI